MQLLYKQACCRWFFTPALQTSCFRKSETVPSSKWWASSWLVFCFCPSLKMLHLGSRHPPLEGSVRFGIVYCFRGGNHANFRDLKATCATCSLISILFFTFMMITVNRARALELNERVHCRNIRPLTLRIQGSPTEFQPETALGSSSTCNLLKRDLISK